MQFEFETRLGVGGNIEGRVIMKKEGDAEPIELDFNMLLTGAEGANLHMAESRRSSQFELPSSAAIDATNNATVLDDLGMSSSHVEPLLKPPPPSAAVTKVLESPGRLGKVFQRFTRRRKRSLSRLVACVDSNQNNSDAAGWEVTACRVCRAPITPTTASSSPCARLAPVLRRPARPSGRPCPR